MSSGRFLHVDPRLIRLPLSESDPPNLPFHSQFQPVTGSLTDPSSCLWSGL